MRIVATGAVTRPDQIGAYLDDESGVLNELRAEGLVEVAFRKIPGPGVIGILNAETLQEAEARMARLPFVAHGLMTFEYTEIVEL